MKYIALLLSLVWAPFVDCLAENLIETPYFSETVAAGKLPPVQDRLPVNPPVRQMQAEHQSVGMQGGSLRILMGKARELRMMMVYGYARLVRYNEKLELVPDLVASFENEDNRVFTFHLYKGHRWSDGHPFTSEDFRYYWEEIANDQELKKFGLPRELLIDKQKPKVEFPDAHTVRYSWPVPNPYFLPALAAPRPLFIYRAGHYLRQFHGKHRPAAELNKLIDEYGVRNWAALHLRKDHNYKFDNPDLPTLQPWRNTTRPPSERFIFERNPYYHWIDEKGQQLPYIDKVQVNIVSSSLISAKTGAGESDLQGRYLRLDNFPFLRAGEERNAYKTRLWKTGVGAQLALYPNMTSNDLVWRQLTRDVRFRRALSLGVDRERINKAIYFGAVSVSNNTVLPESPLYKPEYQSRWAQHDPEQANRLLDEIGLTKRDDKNIRLRPDGKPLHIILQAAGEFTEQSDALELIGDDWSHLGIKLFVKPSQREVFRDRVYSGEAMMSIWTGVDNGLVSAEMSPFEFVPTVQDQYQWSQWGSHYVSGGQAGEAPDIPEAQQLLALNKQWEEAGDAAAKEQIWHQILDIYSDQVFTIGIVNGVGQPIVVSKYLHNVPPKGLYVYAPTAYFGVYKPETFWFDKERRK